MGIEFWGLWIWYVLKSVSQWSSEGARGWVREEREGFTHISFWDSMTKWEFECGEGSKGKLAIVASIEWVSE